MTAVLPGAVTGTARRVLQLEGAAVLLVCLVLFGRSDVSWWLLAATILVPDLAMIGYLAGARTGAALYNAAHWYGWPLLLWVLVPSVPVWVSLVWAAHIGMDRMLGYGLKHPIGFRDTHLGRIGRNG
jgi:hypothetical protein